MPAQADSPSWDDLRKVYDYQPLVATAVTTKAVQDPDYVVVDISFPSEEGTIANGTLVRPAGYQRSPLILLLHGLSEDAEHMLQPSVRTLVGAGYAVFAMDAPHHGKRKTGADDSVISGIGLDWFGDSSQGLIHAVFQADDANHTKEKLLVNTVQVGIRDYRRALDYLAVRPDIDIKRCGAFGYSLGSIMAGVLGGVDRRIESVYLSFGGDPIFPILESVEGDRRLSIASCCPSLYLKSPEGAMQNPPNSCDVGMLNGLEDHVIPTSDSERLFAAVRGSSSTRLALDHFQFAAAVQPALVWFQKTLYVPGGVVMRRRVSAGAAKWVRQVTGTN